MHESARALRRSRTTGVSGILASILFLPAAYCYACPPPDEEPEPDLSAVYVVPQEVWSEAGLQFTLQARVINETGNLLPDTELGALEWTSQPQLFAPSSGPTVMVKPPTGGPFPKTFTVKATFNGVESAPAHVYITDGNILGDVDRVAANHIDGDPPELVLVDGYTSASLRDTLVGIAGVGAVDYLTCLPLNANCGEVTLFSRKHQVYREAQLPLTAGCEAVGLNGDAGFPVTCKTTLRTVPPPRSPKVAIYILASDHPTTFAPSDLSATATPTPTVDPRPAVEWDLGHVNKVLADGWAGISLGTTIHQQPAAQTIITLGEGPSCTEGSPTVKEQLVAAGIPATLMTGDAIVVAYVASILLSTGEEWNGINGLTCPWHKDTGSIILISWSQWVGTTLAHEIVHALGPWKEFPWGHTNEVDGVTSQNIMWEWEDQSSPLPRSRITLGQAFRLSLDRFSIFHRAATSVPPGTFPCQGVTSSEEAPCPRLTKDVVNR